MGYKCKLLLESYEEKKLMSEPHIESENYDNTDQYNDFVNSLDDESLQNLENTMEAMEVDLGNNKRRRGGYGETSVKSEGERERSTRSAGKWPPEKDDYQPTNIPGQYI